MAEVDLDAVEAGLDGDRGALAVLLGDPGDVPVGHGPGHAPAGVEAPGRGQGRRPVGPGVGHRAGVADLGRGRRAGLVHGVGEPLEVGHVVVAEQHAVPIGPALGRDGQIGHGGHGHTAGGHPPVEGHQVVGDLTLGAGPFEGGRLDDPVLQRERAERAGAKTSGAGPSTCWRERSCPTPSSHAPAHAYPTPETPASRRAIMTASARSG